MFNYYAIIIALFTLNGFVVALWFGMKIIRARKTRQWPQAPGRIVKSVLDANGIPQIEFTYQVNDKTYNIALNTPGASDVTPEICQRYLDQYPIEANVQVFYHPDKLEHATLQPGPKRDDWLVFATGLGSALLGGSFLLTA